MGEVALKRPAKLRFIGIVALLCLAPGPARGGEAPAAPPAGPGAPPAASPESTPTGTAAGRPPAPAAPIVANQRVPDATGAPETQVVGFFLRGTMAYQRLRIEDLDIVVTPDGRRLLPILRLARALRIPKTEEGDLVTISPEGGPKTVIDARAGQVTVGPNTTPVALVVAVSDITMQRDIYVPAEIVGEVIGIQLEWSEETYEFRGQTSKPLKIWEMAFSMAGIKAEDEESKLPEKFPTARPSHQPLQFMELEGAVGVTALKDRRFKNADITNVRQTFWGEVAGGRYKVRFLEPSVLYDNLTGFQKIVDSPVQVDWGEWSYRFDNTEVTLGDSSFGLSDLVFPVVRMTGARINGIIGAEKPTEAGKSPGLPNYFVQPYDFDGYAPAGSKVQLVINDRVVQTAQVFADSPNKPGTGSYRFEDIRLSPGVLNDVRVVITDPDGVETQIHKRIVPSSLLLPQGQTAYLAAVGTHREIQQYHTQGVISMARAMYGVTDSLTLGISAADQDRFFEISGAPTAGVPVFPSGSQHVGASAAWQPAEYLMLSGSAAVSRSRDALGDLSGWAAVLRADLYPIKDLNVGAQVFRYGPDFFNGQNLLLRDREGVGAYGRWSFLPQWSMTAAAGLVRDNVDDQLDRTYQVTYNHLQVGTTVIPLTDLSASVDQTHPSEGRSKLTLWTLRARSHLPFGLTFYGETDLGQSLLPEARSDFFSGLALPGISLYQGPGSSGILLKSLPDFHQLGISYWQAADRQRISALHTWHTQGKQSLQIRTEFGMDIFRRQLADQQGIHHAYFENRAEYLLDLTGRNRFGLLSRFELEDWLLEVYANFDARFTFHEGRAVPIIDPRVTPDFGAVHGKVFIDYNASGLPDPGEPGLDNVKVVIGRTSVAITDKQGYFLLPGLRANKEARVALNLDTVPANLSPTHGIQSVVVEPRTLTEVNFGVAPVVSVSGLVVRADPSDPMKPESPARPVAGARVTMTNLDDNSTLGDSYTARDGSYYFSSVHTGKYQLSVDMSTLPKGFGVIPPEQEFSVPPVEEPDDVKPPPFLASRMLIPAEPTPGPAAPSPAAPGPSAPSPATPGASAPSPATPGPSAPTPATPGAAPATPAP